MGLKGGTNVLNCVKWILNAYVGFVRFDPLLFVLFMLQLDMPLIILIKQTSLIQNLFVYYSLKYSH